VARAKLRIAVLPFGESDAPWLEESAKTFIHRNSQRKSGKSQMRNVAYHAGRCALGALLRGVSVGGTIGRNDAWGYLELFDSESKPLAEWRGNISHTEGIAVAVLGPRNVGIDVESIHRSAEKVIRRVSSEKERAASNSKRESEPEFPGDIAIWSAKEAASKALGLGMNFGLQRFEILAIGEAPFSVNTDLKGPLAVHDPAVRFERYEDFLISVCTERSLLLAAPEISKICPGSPGMLST
jgi:phosphopantetheinyl transferase (holo-ACP synthase)